MEVSPTMYSDSNPVPEARRPQCEFFSAGVSREPEINLLKEIQSKMNGTSVVDLAQFKDKFESLNNVRDFVGEDYYFSNKCRDLGIPLFIFPNATISHYGVNGWTGNFHESLKGAGAVK